MEFKGTRQIVKLCHIKRKPTLTAIDVARFRRARLKLAFNPRDCFLISRLALRHSRRCGCDLLGRGFELRHTFLQRRDLAPCSRHFVSPLPASLFEVGNPLLQRRDFLDGASRHRQWRGLNLGLSLTLTPTPQLGIIGFECIDPFFQRLDTTFVILFHRADLRIDLRL